MYMCNVTDIHKVQAEIKKNRDTFTILHEPYDYIQHRNLKAEV